jgi:tryptophan synthase beta chain
MHHQTEVIAAGLTFAQSEGILPAPEACHAIKEAIDQALKAKDNNEKKVIAFNLSGHGFFDLSAYNDYLLDKLIDYELPDMEIHKALTAHDMPRINETEF